MINLFKRMHKTSYVIGLFGFVSDKKNQKTTQHQLILLHWHFNIGLINFQKTQ